MTQLPWYKTALRVLGIVLGVLSVNLTYCEDHPSRCKGVVDVVEQISEI